MTSTEQGLKYYRQIIPVPLTEEAARVLDTRDPVTGELVFPLDENLLKWFVAEGLQRQAEADSLEIVDMTDLGEVEPAKIDARARRQLVELGAPGDEIAWHAYLGVAKRPAWSIWGAAVAAYEAGQEALEQAVPLQLEQAPAAVPASDADHTEPPSPPLAKPAQLELKPARKPRARKTPSKNSARKPAEGEPDASSS